MQVNLWPQRHRAWQGLLDLTSQVLASACSLSEHAFREPGLSSLQDSAPPQAPSSPNQQISKYGDLSSTATRLIWASRLDQWLPFRPANLPSAFHLVLGIVITTKESAL